LTIFQEKGLFCCSSLKSISIPSSIEFIGDDCFCNCSSLSSLRFDSWSKLSRIGHRAFLNCTSLV
jgi:hypothetical protein